MAKKRPNIIPIIEDARHPQKYRMLVPMVDVIFAGPLSPLRMPHCNAQFLALALYTVPISLKAECLNFAHDERASLANLTKQKATK